MIYDIVHTDPQVYVALFCAKYAIMYQKIVAFLRFFSFLHLLW